MGLDQILGYIGLAFVAVSFFFSDIKKLRFLNLIGAICMIVYGFMIEKGLPIAILNIIIVAVNIYYLNKMVSRRDRFDMIKADTEPGGGFDKFFKAHKKDIQRFFPDYNPNSSPQPEVELMMRNFKIVGCFIFMKKGDTAEVLVDYVEPRARDMENSRYLYTAKKSVFKAEGVNKIIAKTKINSHKSYLKKLGFSNQGGHTFAIDVDDIGRNT